MFRLITMHTYYLCFCFSYGVHELTRNCIRLGPSPAWDFWHCWPPANMPVLKMWSM